MSYEIPASLVSNTVWTSAYVNRVIQDLNTLSVHNHSGSLGEGSVDVYSGSSQTTASLVYRFEPHADKTIGFGISNSHEPTGFQVINRLTFAVNADMPRGAIWRLLEVVGASAMLPGFGYSGDVYLRDGKYAFDMYYQASPGGGVMTVFASATSVLIGEIDTYAATCSIGRFSGSFHTNGSVPFTIAFLTSASKNASSNACNFKLGPFSMRWVSS